MREKFQRSVPVDVTFDRRSLLCSRANNIPCNSIWPFPYCVYHLLNHLQEHRTLYLNYSEYTISVSSVQTTSYRIENISHPALMRELHWTLKMNIPLRLWGCRNVSYQQQCFLELLSRWRSHKELRQNVSYVVLCRCHARRLHTIQVFSSIFSWIELRLFYHLFRWETTWIS